MRFAWLSTSQGSEHPRVKTPTERLLLISYNAVWWVPVVLPLLGLMSWRAGTIGFLAVTVIRASINLWRINIMPIEVAQRFPLRLP